MSANDRTGVGAGSGEWQTPPDLFARLNRRFAFDYDAFASHENALLPLYSTIDGTYDGSEMPEPRLLTLKDGLGFPWHERRVFMNPPYTRGLIEQCIEKAVAERHNAAIIVALIPAATETRWFREVLAYCHIDWLPRRVRYVDPRTGKPGSSPPSGAALATFRTDLMT